MERTGRPAAGFQPQSLVALKEFVSSLPKNAVVKVGNHSDEPLQLTALTQRRVEEASRLRPVPQRSVNTRREAVSEEDLQSSIAGNRSSGLSVFNCHWLPISPSNAPTWTKNWLRS